MRFRGPLPRSIRFIALLLFAVSAATAPALERRPQQLFDAAAQGDTRTVFTLLRSGVSPAGFAAHGDTALHAAVRAGHFDAARLLLAFGQSASAPNRRGETPLDLCDQLTSGDHLDLHILLRAFAFLETIRPQNHPDVTHRDRVLILENTVNYLHPRIARNYAVNAAERDGRPGVDDDGNGYIDDTYGWDPAAQRPYVINPLQFEVYLKNRDIIGRLLHIEQDVADGTISSFEGQRLLNGFTNPLAQIMGPTPELTDGAFIDMLKSAAHGSHVAGIILANSDDYASLSTVQIESVRSPSLIFEDQTESIVLDLIRRSDSLADYLDSACAVYRERRLAIGLRYAKYIGSTGAGVANLSFGNDYGFAKQMVSSLANYYLNATGPFPGDNDELESIVDDRILDFYLADTIPWATVFYLNPDVLFVCAAGNENQDNDRTFGAPGYLARLLPNVITVAAVDQANRITDFSDYGRHVVQLAALGQDVLSTVIPEADVYMDGTSMAAPAVAGAAARLRALDPTNSAPEVRSLLLYSSREVSGLNRYTVSGGVLDLDLAFATVRGDDPTRAKALVKLARRALALPADDVPEGLFDAKNFLQQALSLDPANAAAKTLLRQIDSR